MIIGILKESPQERRVAMPPAMVESLVKKKVTVMVEKGAGEQSFHSDEEYKPHAEVTSKEELLKKADVLIKISAPEKDDLSKMRDGQVLISVLNPMGDVELTKSLLKNKTTSFSLDILPRTSKAQAMDILSSMATAAGYKAVLDAAMHLPHFFPMFMTAAGTIAPAKVLILGAGVAGLQAIATARRLGARVEAFDVRSAVKEEVMSLGAKFVEVEGALEDAKAGGYGIEQTEEFKKRQQQTIHEHAAAADVIISTAQIPGRKAPVLIKKETVEAMKPGSVIIDLASSSGGNCELTQKEADIVHNGVSIIGKTAYPSTIPTDASKMFGKNVFNFISLMIDDEGNMNLDFEEELLRESCVSHQGEYVSKRIKEFYKEQ